jgi:hypothetical protein
MHREPAIAEAAKRIRKFAPATPRDRGEDPVQDKLQSSPRKLIIHHDIGFFQHRRITTSLEPPLMIAAGASRVQICCYVSADTIGRGHDKRNVDHPA